MIRKVIVLSLVFAASCLMVAGNVSAQRCIITADAVKDFEKPGGLLDFIVDSDGQGTSFAEWHLAIKGAQNVNTFNVSGHVRLQENIIKADLVTFTEGSTLEFMNVDAPFWAIVTRNLVFQGKNVTIRRNAGYTIATPAPVDGSNGRSGGGRNCCAGGRAGGRGEDGRHGTMGGSRNLPCFLVIAESVDLESINPDAISVEMAGISGGRGGDGGRGGNGGHGQAGANASFGTFKCKREPQDGGRGGNGGNGGNAGPGGNGGAGGDVLFIGSRDHGTTFMRFQIHNEGGPGGGPGEPGRPGNRGNGGDRGHRRGRPCFRSSHSGAHGSDGRWGSKGAVGATGDRGREQIIVVKGLPYW